MATKQSIIDNIANKLLASNLGRLVLDTDLQEALASDVESIVNEAYVTTSVTDDQTTTNVFTTGGLANVTYSLSIKKQGGFVHVNGALTNGSGSLAANNLIATITDAEYDNSDTVNINAFNFIVVNDDARIALIGNELRVAGSGILENQSFNFSFTYFVGQ